MFLLQRPDSAYRNASTETNQQHEAKAVIYLNRSMQQKRMLWQTDIYPPRRKDGGFYPPRRSGQRPLGTLPVAALGSCVETSQHANQHANHQLSWRASGPHKRDKSGLPTALGSPLRPAYVSPATESTTTSAYSLPTSGHNQQQHPLSPANGLSLAYWLARPSGNNPPQHPLTYWP